MVKGVLKPRAQGRKAPKSQQQRNQLAPVEEPSSEEFDDFGRALDAAAGDRGGRRRRRGAAANDEDEQEEEEEAVLGISDSDSGSDDDDDDSGSDDDDDDDGEQEEEEDDDDDLDAMIARGGKAGRLARQAKHLEQELRVARGERDTSSEEEDEEGKAARKARREAAAAGGAAAWGANKRRYYGGDDADEDGSGDEEGEDEDDEAAARAEEQEARRLQAERAAGLAAEDFGLSDEDDDDDDEDDEGESDDDEDDDEVGGKGGRGGSKKASAKTKAPSALVREERVAKAALADLPDEARRAALEADAPELLALLDELRGALSEVRARCGPLLREVRAGGLATAGGLSYLEAKHLLLTQYCACLVSYLLLRAEGRPVRGHPVVARLVQLRAYLERARPIDRRLAYQVDKLLRATQAAQQAERANGAANGGGADADAAAAAAAAAAGGLRPNPAAFVGADEVGKGARQQQQRGRQQQQGGGEGDEGEEDGGAEGGAYRPPRLEAASMELDAEIGPDGQPVRRATARERHALREAARRARRSELVRELAAELEGAPEELRAEQPGLDSSAALLAARQRMEARARVEEELFARVPLSKAEAKKLKAQQRAGLAGQGGALDDFADEVADLVGLGGGASGGGGGSGAGGLLGRLSQRFGADLADQAAADAGAGASKALRSGDADIARRPSLHERRAAFDGAAGRRAAREAADEDEAPPPTRPGAKRGAAAGGTEEDEFYAASRAARQAAKRLKGEAAAQQRAAERMLPPPLPEAQQADGELRPITDAIQRNRGLTPHRRRDLKNPRKKHRVKYAQAGVRRKGQVQGVREAPATAGGYGGEATGIKARLARGRKLG